MNEFFRQNGKFTKTSELEGLSIEAQSLANSIVRNHEVLSAKEHEYKGIIFDVKNFPLDF